MQKIIENFVNQKSNGLMLLDLPTGFGKTTSVIKFIDKFINSNTQSVKRIYFVTNLKKNLPEKRLKKSLGDNYDKYCLYLKPYWESVTEKWKLTQITNPEVLNAEEYKNLNLDIETLYKFREDNEKLRKAKDFNQEYVKNKRLIQSYEQKIERDTEVKFRQFIKKTFFYNQTVYEKDKFLKNNQWIAELYPACKLKEENIKVVLSSTKKFFSPMDTFSRMPFYIYNNEALTENSITFIDEFDTTKETLLDQIIDDGLKFDIDIFALFLNIYYSLTNLSFPVTLMRLSDYRKGKIEKEEWVDIKELIEELKKKFQQVYEDYQLQFLVKSKGFEEKKAFIFDDGKSLNIFSDKSKKVLKATYDKDENINSLLAVAKSYKGQEKERLDNILLDVKFAINSFINKSAYISKNYTDYKNQSLKGYKIKYSFEESALTILSAFNVADEYRQYLLDRIIDRNANMKLDLHVEPELEFMNKGFEYTELEDDHEHDLQTKCHAFKFDTTPEAIIAKLCVKSRAVGISATASIETVIGNYDIEYFKKVLQDDFYSISDSDYARLEQEFMDEQKTYEENNITIHTAPIDGDKVFSDKENCIQVITSIFNEKNREYYLNYLENDTEHYHSYIICKLLKLYTHVAASRDIYSFLAFLNSFPKTQDKADRHQFLNKDFLERAISDLIKQNGYENAPIIHIVRSDNFEEEFAKINEELAEGKKVFVLSTYRTMGNGQNIQYKIPDIESIKSNVIINNKDRLEKDFDAIYLLTPTNLVQMLSYDLENRVNNLCKYLFQQEYLYKKNYISFDQRKINIESGFRKTFYGDRTTSSYRRNEDILLHTAQLTIQAVGRICRCQNKNKNIYIFYDQEILNRLNLIKDDLTNGKKIFNKEFRVLLEQPVHDERIVFDHYTLRNKKAYGFLTKMSKEVRKSKENVSEWQELRNFVLKHPTANNIPDKYAFLYFKFDTPVYGYAYRFNNNYEFVNFTVNNTYEKTQVSAEGSELIRLMSIPELREYFARNGYATNFERGIYVMSESLYKQIYKGALGEAVGRYIISKACGCDLEELDNYQQYEAFDFKINNIYFDFKHWDYFIKDNDSYSKFIEWKLKTVQGAKVVVANIFQRGNHKIRESVDGKIIQIPYLINDDNEIDYKYLDILLDLI